MTFSGKGYRDLQIYLSARYRVDERGPANFEERNSNMKSEADALAGEKPKGS